MKASHVFLALGGKLRHPPEVMAGQGRFCVIEDPAGLLLRCSSHRKNNGAALQTTEHSELNPRTRDISTLPRQP